MALRAPSPPQRPLRPLVGCCPFCGCFFGRNIQSHLFGSKGGKKERAKQGRSLSRCLAVRPLWGRPRPPPTQPPPPPTKPQRPLYCHRKQLCQNSWPPQPLRVPQGRPTFSFIVCKVEARGLLSLSLSPLSLSLSLISDPRIESCQQSSGLLPSEDVYENAVEVTLLQYLPSGIRRYIIVSDPHTRAPTQTC